MNHGGRHIGIKTEAAIAYDQNRVIPIEDMTILIIPKGNYSFGVPSRLAVYSL